jgi:aminoglycoside phosphotransferase family enzyme/predicted kinase
VPEDQSDVLAFLADPATHGGAEVARVDTHSAHVFLAGDTAWKIKRAVRYDYLDFSTLEKRKAILDRELALNAPAAPTLYRRVVPVTRAPDGSLALDGIGTPVEYALEMRRFPAEAQLDRVAEAGRLDAALAGALGEAVAAYHAAAPHRAEDGAALIGEIVAELDRVFATMRDDLGPEAVDGFGQSARSLHARLGPLLTRRSAEGHVRRCHSDLHLANIVLEGGRPIPFDALEFDERLGTCDTAYDIAFLLMDLDQRGLAAQANLCLNAWLTRTGDLGALAALPLFLAVRAAIRAMVAVQTARATGSPVPPEAQGFLTRATAYLHPATPRLVAVGGLSGTGKTTVARLAAPHLPPVPGAVHLRTDVIRKALLGADPLFRLPAERYGPDVSRQVYDRLLADARTCLAAGHSVILDATFLDPAQRQAARTLAMDHPAVLAWLSAPPDALLARVSARQGDASDADEAVVRAQLARDPGPLDWTPIDASGPPEETAQILARIALGQSRPRKLP